MDSTFSNALDSYFLSLNPKAWAIHSFTQHYKTLSSIPSSTPDDSSSILAWKSRLERVRARTAPFEKLADEAVGHAKRMIRAMNVAAARKVAAKRPVNNDTQIGHVSRSNVITGAGDVHIVYNNSGSASTDAQGRPKKRSRKRKAETPDESRDTPTASTPSETSKIQQFEEPVPNEESSSVAPLAASPPPPPVDDPEPSSSQSTSISSDSISPLTASFFTSTKPDLPLPTLPSRTGLRSILKFCLRNGDIDKSSDFYAELEQHVFFVDRAEFADLLCETNVKHLRTMIPTITDVSTVFMGQMELYSDYVRTGSFSMLPRCPDDLDVEDRKVWGYITAAVMHFVQHLPVLTARGPSHGEGWYDVNVWAHLLDTAFLYSSTLSLDRKELQSNVIVPKKPSYDGIMRSTSISSSRRLDLGYIEVKPGRAPYEISSAGDRTKVITAMKSSLCHLKQQIVDQETMRKIVVIGVLCNGMTMTVIRAWNLESDFLFFREATMELEMGSLEVVVRTCWRIKLALESSYEIISNYLTAQQGLL